MYRRDAKGWLKHFDFMILDLMVLQTAFVLSYMLRHGWVNPYWDPLYASMGIFLMLFDLVIIFFTEPFRNILKRGYYREMEAVLQQAIFVELFAVLYLFAQQAGEEYSRISMMLLGVLYVGLGYSARLIWKQVLKKTRRNGSRSLLVVCSKETAVKTIKNIRDHNYGSYNIAGLVLTDRDFTGMELNGVPVVAEAEDAAAYAQKNWVDEVFVNLVDTEESPQKLKNFPGPGTMIFSRQPVQRLNSTSPT